MKMTVLLLSVFLGGGPSWGLDQGASATRQAVVAPKVVAYYFHSTRRCPTCRKIEASSLDALQKRFTTELKSGALAWQVVNIDEAANRHFVKDFDLFASSLVLVSHEKGKPRWKNLDQVWQLVHNPESFSRYVEEETRKFIKGS